MNIKMLVLIGLVISVCGCTDNDDYKEVWNDHEPIQSVYKKDKGGFRILDVVKSTDEFNQKYNNSFMGKVERIWSYDTNESHLEIRAYYPTGKTECDVINNITYCEEVYSDFDKASWIRIFDETVVVTDVNQKPSIQIIYVHNTSWIEHT